VKKKESIKMIVDSLIDDRPKLFIFETEKEEIEINAMDFRDAVLTLEERDGIEKFNEIISIQEISSPIPGVDTIH
tara:strand:+ start:381 stop:605 length:225 start_codon:yes stop_codon:yes gene_type:complete